MSWFVRKKKSVLSGEANSSAANESGAAVALADENNVPEIHTSYDNESGAHRTRFNNMTANQRVSREPLLVVSSVHRSFPVGNQQLHVLKGIDLTLYKGQLVMLRGRSGSGKTTLLNLIGGLDQPDKGEIMFRDQPFHLWNDQQRTRARRKEIGFIFQMFALMPLLSAWENVELSLRMAGVPQSEWKNRVGHCLELVGLARRMKHRPFELSGGEQQRVAIAKAIAHKPALLLADEPTAELDSQMGAHVIAVFREIIRTENITICMTTHDPTILEVADHVFEMVDGKFVT